MRKIRKDDQVIVIAGRDKGRTGRVTGVLRDGRLHVSGVNMIKRHTKGNPQMARPGGIIEKEAPIQASNVAIFNSSTNRADKVAIRKREDGTRVRVFNSTGEEIDGHIP